MKRIETEISDGDAGIDQIVKEMWRLINKDTNSPEIKRIAQQVQRNDTLETTKAAYEYVWKNYRYVPDPPDAEHLTAPRHMASGKRPFEDCDGLVMVLAAILQTLKIPVRVKTIAWRKHDYTHVIAEFKYKNSWIPLDPTRKADGFGNQVRTVIREKIYGNPMGKMITLDDNMSSCGCNKKSGSNSQTSPAGNNNQNIINIGNEIFDYARTGLTTGQQQAPQAAPAAQIIEKKVPYEVEKVRTITMPVRTVYGPSVINYKEFY